MIYDIPGQHGMMAGNDLRTLLELGGWSSYEMVFRYAHMSQGQLHHVAEKLATICYGVNKFSLNVSNKKRKK